MLRTKTDVDRHVAEILRKVKSEREKNLKCYNIALMYYKVRDYESAKLYVSMYLLAKEDAPLANKLLGQIYEALGQKERALAAYKTSLEYESNQPDLVLKICELMCETDVTLDADRARYWCERGSEFFPHDPAIFRLKERLLVIGGSANSLAFEQLIHNELKARPSDVNVRIRLLKLYLETNRVKAAYDHAVELESRQIFRNERTWYECFSEICKTYYEQNSAKLNWEFYLHWVSVLDRATRLTLMEGHGASPTSIADCVQAVFDFDQALYKADACITSKETLSAAEFYKEFVKHMSAQLYLHMATLTFKKAKNEHSNWKEASQSVAPLLFLAMARPVDMEALWILSLKDNFKKYLQVYRNDAYYRVSQAGYVLLGLAKETGNQFTDKVTLKTTKNWRERVFQRIFSTRDHRAAVSTSHLVHTPLAEKLDIRLPVHNAPPLYTSELVSVFEKINVKSLHHLVWLGVEVLRHNNYKLPPEFHTYSFTALPVTGNKVGGVSVESLNRLDIDAFLYLSVFCASAISEEEILNGYHSSDRPLTLPADISNMCTLEQAEWWKLLSALYTQNFKNNSDYVKVRQTLQQGIEVVRIIGNHGLDVQLIVKLARTFSDRASHKQTDSSMLSTLEGRANLYWSAAILLLEKNQHNQMIRSPVKCLFKCPKKDLSSAEVSSLLEEGRYFVACQLMKEEEHERAIEAFQVLRSPHASFNQALIYKKLADAEFAARPPEDITSEIRSKHTILLTKARDCLYTTKERIRLDKRNPLHASLAQLFEEIESALVRVEPDFDHRRDDGLASDVSVSSVGSPVVESSRNISRQNGRLSHGFNASTPQRVYGHGDFRRKTNTAEYVEVGQLLQIQTLVDQNRKILEKIDTMSELLQQLTVRVDGLCEDMRKLKPPGPEDLYIFGEEEDYGEDVLGQYPANFAAPHYYPSRGVQGTSTLTYGAPTIPPPGPQFYPTRVEPTVAYQPPLQAPLGALPPVNFYNQNALPFSEGQQLPDFMRTPGLPNQQVLLSPCLPKEPVLPTPVLPNQPGLPANVVITTPDTVPTGPLQYHLGTIPVPSTPPVHNFQIMMPPTANILSVDKSPMLAEEEFDSDDEPNTTVERDPYPDFQPIIPLPDEVVVHTGEEGETVLFENRAKLYRHVDKEWKERGVGVLKILKNESSGQIRLLMRRDQVLKICANHLLKSDMELTPLKNSNCAYMWVANDFADETVQLETLCAKFKTPEEALKFKDVFSETKKTCGISPVKPKKDDGKDTEKHKSNKSVEQVKVNFGGFTFSSTPTVKSPEKVSNKIEEKKDTQPASSPFTGFSFTAPKTSNDSLPTSAAKETSKLGGLLRQPLLSVSLTTPKPEVTKMQPKSILKESPVQPETIGKTQPSCSAEKPQQKHVLFQDTKPETVSDKISEIKSPSLKDLLMSNDKTSNIIDFATLSKMNDNVPAFTGSADGKKQFEGAGSTVFGRQKRDGESEATDDFVPTAEFKPVIPLPELVDIKTGEEGQEVLFEERSKLFRFDSNTKEWKERGVGKMKILKDPTSGAVRFLMRREQVLKLCCNHRITSNLEMNSHLGSDRAWTWTAQDYAEGEMRNELFAVRFKNSDQAKAFKMVVEQVLKDLKTKSVQSPSTPVMPVTPINVWKCSCLFPNSTDSSYCRACKKQKPRTDAVTPKLSEWTRAKPARWECSNCYTTNEPKENECGTCGSPKKSSLKSPQTVPLSEVPSLKPKTGSWNCQDCYLSNEPVLNVCSACGAKKPDTQEPLKQSLADIFKPKQGSWSCSVCYVCNEAAVETCVACQTLKPKVEEQPKEDVKPLSELYKPKPGSWSCPECLVLNDAVEENCVACQTSRPGAEKSKLDRISKSLSEMFKPKAGSWECSGCLVRNDADKTSCPACNTLKPGHQPQDEGKSSDFIFGSSTFNFGMPTNELSKGGFKFEKPASTVLSESTGFGLSKPNASSGFTFGMPLSEKKDSGFSFGIPNETKKEEKQLFNFGTVQTDTQPSEFKFTSNDKSQSSGSPFSSSSETGFHTGELFSFGGSGKSEFNFGGIRTPKSPADRVSESEPDEVEEDDGDHIHFQPVVPLPDKVDVKTGEEDEEVLYSHRSKLYRYMNGEWKERGVGDIKILRNFSTKKIRLLMRREPIMKLCLNHYLTPELNFSPKDSRAWLWTALDYAEEQLKAEQFCLLFKTPDIAAEFKMALDVAQNELQSRDESVSSITSTPTNTAEKQSESPAMKAFSFNFPGSSSPSVSPFSLATQFGGLTTGIGTTPSKSIFGGSPQAEKGPGPLEQAKTVTEGDPSDKDVEVVYENDVTEEEREAALKLQLPAKFYSYRRAPPCPGCVGCEADDDDTSEQDLTSEQKVKPAGIMYEVCTEPALPPTEASVIVVSKSTSETRPNTANSTFGSSLFGTSSSNFNPTFGFGTRNSVETEPWFGNSLESTNLVTNSAPIKSQSTFGSQLGSAITMTTSSPQSNSIFDGSIGCGTNNSETSKIVLAGVPLTPSETPKSHSLFGGTPVSASDTPKSQSLFGGTPVPASDTPKTQSLFDGMSFFSSDTQKTRSLFGGTPVSASDTPKTQSLFGGMPVSASDTPKTQSLFGGMPVSASDTPKTQSLFGGMPVSASDTPKTQSLFGGMPVSASDTPKTQSLFGGMPVSTSDTPKTQSLFGGAAVLGEAPKQLSTFGNNTNIQKSQSFFGSSGYTKSENLNDGTKSVFGVASSSAEPAQFSFGGITSQQFTFGSTESNKSQFNFGASPNSSEMKSQGLLSGGDSFSFAGPALFSASSFKGEASFAQIATDGKAPGFQANKENFTWAGEGTPLFNRTTKTTPKPEKTGDEGDSSGDEGEADQSHDPHFEPIVPLPAAIQVRTGEEDEIREFCQRAKLYRYNNATKEWKERGVGEMKILRHPVNNTYRLLMRREQVHKVVCNHLLTETLEMNMMPNSETSLTWGTMNLSDEMDAPQLELLALKFKTIDLCQQFKVKVDECIQQVIKFKQAGDVAGAQIISSPSKPDSTVDDNDEAEDEEDYEGNDDDYYDEDDEVFELLFEKPATLFTRVEDVSDWVSIGAGDLQIMYDRDLFASRIFLKDNNETLLFNSIISGDSRLLVEGMDCVWIAEEGAQVMARFHSEASAEEFRINFYDGVNFAEKALI